MENIYEIVGFSVIWGGAGALIGTFVGALEQALKERKKAKLANIIKNKSEKSETDIAEKDDVIKRFLLKFM
ncbi:MAG: hypothetical protein ACLSXJ_06890 [Clostridium saudiense]|uniref:hypothetical protein n=1 Tax=Clostridium saudiense TaxID=1414720 RepID=UPI003990E2FC